MKTIAFDLHDASVLRTRYDLLFRLKEHYPNLKVSLFYIPFDAELEMVPQFRIMREQKLEQMKQMRDWVEYIPHGITHQFGEFSKCDKATMDLYIKSIAKECAKDGVKIVKGFCAPNWLWSNEAVNVLDKHNWWGAVDRNQPNMATPKRFYRYTHSITEPFWQSNEDVWKLHGHMTGPSENALENAMVNLMKMPHDAKFVFASELVETKKI